MVKVIKRNGTQADYDKAKIEKAVAAAAEEVGMEVNIGQIIGEVELALGLNENLISAQGVQYFISVEGIQDNAEWALWKNGYGPVGKAYGRYRYMHELARSRNLDNKMLQIVNYQAEDVKQENANKNPQVLPTQRDYIAGEASKHITLDILLPNKIAEAHKKGIIHFHDADYFVHHMHNCDLVNLDDMLQNGTVISGVTIDKPKLFSTACNIATQIIAQVASHQYGGQSISLYHLSKFVQSTRDYYSDMLLDDEDIDALVERDIMRGIQTIQYQIVTLMTTNGQAPFITVYMDLTEAPDGQQRVDLAMCIAEVLTQRIQGVKNEAGQWVGPAFPKLIYALDTCNTYPESEYYWLTELAAECTSKRMVPDYISLKKMRELKKGDTYTCMGCRSFLTPDRFTDAGIGNIANAKNYVEGEHRYYGRLNQGVCTINLPYIACLSSDLDAFWETLDSYLELCHEALKYRHKRLKGTKSDVAPILWQHGALARLNPGDVIDPLLYNGYSTISLGYAGLWECVYKLIGEPLTNEAGEKLGLAIMQELNDKCAKWKAEENIDYSVYGTPIESTTYKFAKALKNDFGVIEGVSDKDYITNSYHVHVTQPIDAFSKLDIEAKFQALSPGGAISYVEVPNLSNNLDAVLTVIQHIYETIMYAELNCKFDSCHECGYQGEFEMVDNEEGKRVWHCPQCGNEDPAKYDVLRRVCGYLSSNEMNQGRMQEIDERVLHL